MTSKTTRSTPAAATVPPRAAAARYAVAVAGVAGAAALRWALEPALPTGTPFITFFPAVVIAAWYGGLGPGLLATGLCALASLLFLEPMHSAIVVAPENWLAWAIFVAIDLTLVALVASLHRARRRVRCAADDLLAAQNAVADQTTRRFRLMADHAPVMIWLCDTDNKGTWFNKPWLDFVGRTLEQELGDRWAESVHPEDLPRCLAICGGSFAKRQPFRMEFRLRRHDGEYRWVLDHGVPVYESDGRFGGYIGSCIDITERRRAEAELRTSEERLRLALLAGKTGVWDWDIRANRVTWSDRLYELHGLRPDEFAGTVEAFAKLVHPDDAGRVQAEIERAMRREIDSYAIEFRTIRPDGAVRWIATQGRVTFDADGRPLRMMGATIDTTERKQAEAEREHLLASERAARGEAERASRTKDEFLATLSHELRTPLNAILGWAQLLRSSRAGPHDLAQGLESIERNSRAQAQLIEDLLDMSRIISGKLRLDAQRTDLLPVIDAAIETVRPAADARGIHIQRVLDAQTGPVWADPGRLRQILWNLLSNAIKFTPPGGRVTVRLAPFDGSVQISVSDTGQGIKPEFLPHVFDRFRQADASTTRRHGGLGLGLAIVKHLAELQGGSVRAESDGENRGATFTVTLPLMTPAQQHEVHRFAPGAAATSTTAATTAKLASNMPAPDADAARESPQPMLHETPSLRGVTVLAVDDDADALEVIRRVLQECEATVLTAGSAREALALLDRAHPDVLVSDISMPEVDGYDLIRTVRAREAEWARGNGAAGAEDDGDGGRVARLPAAALTAFARPEDRTRSILEGYQAHVSKPVEPAELAAVVASLAGRTGVGNPLASRK